MRNTLRWNYILKTLSALTIVSVIVSSCVPTASKSTGRGRKSANLNGSFINVGVTQGAILADNPIILSGNANLAINTDLNTLASVSFITNESFLKSNHNCAGLDYCFEVRETKDSSSALQTANGKWGFSTESEEFLQVNTFYHLDKIFNDFFANLQISRGLTQSPTFKSSIPFEIYNPDGSFLLSNRQLTAYSNCDVENNAFFDRTNETLCFGYTKGTKKLRWATDSTIIYHEVGHYFQNLQLNLRNIDNIIVKAELGGIQYDEAGSIGEGLADFYSYYMNGRSHWGEWAAGRFLQASRPISEDDALHSPGISADRDQRLTYPQYLNYDPNFPKTPAEDIHLSGMIISHYLVALTQELQLKCSMPQKEAAQNVMHLVTETLAELGDLTTTSTGAILLGPPRTLGKINLSKNYALDWQRTVNPITYRSFSQTIAKNLYNNLGNPVLNRCGGGVYSRDNIEALLDDYGLLLFKTYNENRNLRSTLGLGTPISPTNRKKSILISKNSLILDPSPEANVAFVIDNRAQIAAGIKALQSSGVLRTTLSQQTPSDLSFNNGNSKVSPGEVVAIALNLYNNSNSQMGGIQILANDWNHADANGKPYLFPENLTNDQWPLLSEGGVNYPLITPIQATLPTDFAPVCFIQYNDSGSTRWVSQTEFQNKMALSDSMCLNPSSPKDCFVRALKGADQAHFSKINPKSTWGQTLADPETGKAYSLDWGNVLMFEVSKHIPPGTTIDCRLRLRFTNCDDCYHDLTSTNPNNDYKRNDYVDSEYNGPKPFKIIHLQIPITD